MPEMVVVREREEREISKVWTVRRGRLQWVVLLRSNYLGQGMPNSVEPASLRHTKPDRWPVVTV